MVNRQSAALNDFLLWSRTQGEIGELQNFDFFRLASLLLLNFLVD